jgi:CRISPR/Cas system-associated exonuclease Cas4 (RecB family)
LINTFSEIDIIKTPVKIIVRTVKISVPEIKDNNPILAIIKPE